MKHEQLLRNPYDFKHNVPWAGGSGSWNQAHRGGVIAVGGWKELGRTTLGSANSALDVTSFADKRYYMILSSFDLSASGNPYSRYNSNGSAVYSSRTSTDGAADFSLTSNSNGLYGSISGVNANPYFVVDYASNLSAHEKFTHRHVTNRSTAGAANAPQRGESIGKMADTTNPLDDVNWHDVSGNNFNTDSECVVLGWDPDDTHTDNFWEELASVDLSGGASDTLSSGTFTAKKYLFVRAYMTATGGSARLALRLGNATLDSSANYCRRFSINQGADTTQTSTSATGFNNNMSGAGYVEFFILNISGNEKLVIGHNVYWNTSGAATAPNREEMAGKWVNTSNQANILAMFDSGGTGQFGTGSFMTVWGSD